MDNGKNTNILKVRDDRDCIKLIWDEAEDKVNLQLMLPINQIGVLVTPVRKANCVLVLSLG